MITSPISIRRDGYRGMDQRKRQKARDYNDLAARMERHINDLIDTQEEAICSYLHIDIARQMGEDPELVARLGFSIDGGHNGFTAIKPGLSRDELDAAMGRKPRDPGDLNDFLSSPVIGR